MKQITTETQLLKDLKKIGQRISRRIKDRYDIPLSVKSDVDEEVANAILYLLGKHDNRSKLLTYINNYAEKIALNNLFVRFRKPHSFSPKSCLQYDEDGDNIMNNLIDRFQVEKWNEETKVYEDRDEINYILTQIENAQMQQILEMLLEGYTIREIGAKLGIAKSKVWRMIENFKTKIGEIRNEMEY